MDERFMFAVEVALPNGKVDTYLSTAWHKDGVIMEAAAFYPQGVVVSIAPLQWETV